MTIDEAIQRLADFIKSLPDFRVYEQHEIETHDHIGAAIADAVLQARRDYYSVVAPRTERILKRWPEAKTVSAVLECLKSVSADEFLDWSDNQSSSNYLAYRVQRFVEILMLLKNSGVESTDDLKDWLTVRTQNASKQKSLSDFGGQIQVAADIFKSISEQLPGLLRLVVLQLRPGPEV